MAENLDRVVRSSRSGGKPQQETTSNLSKALEDAHIESPTPRGPQIYLPDEIILQILDYVSQSKPSSQRTLASCALLSHQWFAAATPLLYAHPYLYGSNFDPFVRAICPSINLHVRKSPLSELVRVLNMSNLVHQGSKSLTARLLGRTKGGLEEFVAPQASFAMNCFPALSKCAKLRVLDLSLVSESPPLPEIFKTIAHLQNLRTFRLPRSAGYGAHSTAASFVGWPPNLEHLSLSGGIDAHFMQGVVAFPQTLKSVTIEHCPQTKPHAVTLMLKRALKPLKGLESLVIRHMPRLSSHTLDDVLILLPQIQRLSVSVDYITPAIFDESHFHHIKDPLSEVDYAVEPLQHANLRVLELTNSGNPGVEDKISPIDIMIALDEGVLPMLRQVRVAKSLRWHAAATSSDAEALADALQERAETERESGLSGAGAEEAGVWMFDG